MGRMYSVTFDNVATTTAADFFELTPADDKPIKILGIDIGQSTEAGDAASEMLRWAIIRGFTVSGSGGSAATPRPLSSIDTAAGFTAETMNTTLANTGTSHTLHASTFNVMTGLQWVPTPEIQCAASQADTTIVVRLVSTPGDSITFSGTVYVEELY